MGETAQAHGRPATRDALLDAVDELLEERGWAACSLQAVARRAGLTTGAVYSTFGSRGALLAAAMTRRQQHLIPLPPAELDIEDAIAALAISHYRAIQKPEGRNLGIAQLDLIRLATAEPAIADTLRKNYSDLLSEIAADFEARGATAPALPLARRVVSVLQGLTMQHIAFGEELSQDEFVATTLGVLL